MRVGHSNGGRVATVTNMQFPAHGMPAPVKKAFDTWGKVSRLLGDAERNVQVALEAIPAAQAQDKLDLAKVAAQGKSLEGVGVAAKDAEADYKRCLLVRDSLLDAVEEAGTKFALTVASNLEPYVQAQEEREAEAVARFGELLEHLQGLLPTIADSREASTFLRGNDWSLADVNGHSYTAQYAPGSGSAVQVRDDKFGSELLPATKVLDLLRNVAWREGRQPRTTTVAV